ncbi:MAG TPA: hypothetical protein VNN18_11530 [Candidatus Xenobia bacterium]|nr:hypothetical protein [Candidatus Xenobia bacterium]
MSLVISLTVLGGSVAALVFWLHTTLQNIVRGCADSKVSAEVAVANHLCYRVIRQALETDGEQPADARACIAALERDYSALTYLLRNAATVHLGHYTTRERLLVMDFQVLRLAVRVQHALNWPGWRTRLLEMSRILDYFGDTVGQRFEAFAVSRQV